MQQIRTKYENHPHFYANVLWIQWNTNNYAAVYLQHNNEEHMGEQRNQIRQQIFMVCKMCIVVWKSLQSPYVCVQKVCRRRITVWWVSFTLPTTGNLSRLWTVRHQMRVACLHFSQLHETEYPTRYWTCCAAKRFFLWQSCQQTF